MIADANLHDRGLLKRGILPHADELSRIAVRSEVAVIVFEPHDSVLPRLEAMGWKGRPIFSITRARGEKDARKSCDHILQRWAARPSDEECLRILVVTHSETVLVNYAPGEGFRIEPGSTEGRRFGESMTLDERGP
jgi:hypothetical protein